MAPRDAGNEPAQDPTSQASSNLPHEPNPFIAFRRAVDQQFESVFNAMLSAPREENQSHTARQQQLPNTDKALTPQEQIDAIEHKLEGEIKRAREEASKMLPWFWQGLLSENQLSKENEPRRRSMQSYEAKLENQGASYPSPSPKKVTPRSETKDIQEPDTEEQAYLFLNFPHAREQIHSAGKKAAALQKAKEQDEREHFSFFGPMVRELTGNIRTEDTREQAESNDLVSILRAALRGVEPWEQARVTSQLPSVKDAREGKEGRRWHRQGSDRWREECCHAAQEKKQGVVGLAGQQLRTHEEKDAPDRTVKSPWWWLGAVWDSTFPREADGYDMKRCQHTSTPEPAPVKMTASPKNTLQLSKYNLPMLTKEQVEASESGACPFVSRTEERTLPNGSKVSETTKDDYRSYDEITQLPDGTSIHRTVTESRDQQGKLQRKESIMTFYPATKGPNGKISRNEYVSRKLPVPEEKKDTDRLQRKAQEWKTRQPTPAAPRPEQPKSKGGWFWAS
ncbi:MAG: hypothetical protein M1820_004012 [Bogoriella megaspora]|nr:MAG: hypothetical protein M1820_004012 [Bogoriella megaspora]